MTLVPEQLRWRYRSERKLIMAEFDREDLKDKGKGEKTGEGTGKKEINSSFSGEGFSLQNLVGSLQNDPQVIRHLSFEKISEIAEIIGNQQLAAILGGGGPLLRKGDFHPSAGETDINDISTETPELIELG
ncbi:hypothetical protein QYZ88_017975 [Lachnospiraceae bacterium C1.1]|nr:hypothetical protein [Lachnospiraceae bacterium C1.1]